MLAIQFEEFTHDTFQALYHEAYEAIPGGEVIDFIIEDDRPFKVFDPDSCLDQFETRWSMRGLPGEYGKIPKKMRGDWLWDMATYLNNRALESKQWKDKQWYHVWYDGHALLIHMAWHSLKAATNTKGRFRATEVYLRRMG